MILRARAATSDSIGVSALYSASMHPRFDPRRWLRAAPCIPIVATLLSVATMASSRAATDAPPPDVPIPPGGALLRVDGFPIVSGKGVDPRAAREAGYWLKRMLAHRPDARRAMVASGTRLRILGVGEYTCDAPEFAWLGQGPDIDGVSAKDWWDARARGTGGSATDPVCSVGEENVLGYPGDPYAAESILLHEFAHSIHLRGMNAVDAGFDDRVKAAYDAAKAAGLWRGTYASTNPAEYFAEGAQSWFDDNREFDHDHNHVDTRRELEAYDPGLAALCREVFGDRVEPYSKPATRLTGHLRGYDPSSAPRFAWPDRLKAVKDRIRAGAQARATRATGGLAAQLSPPMPVDAPNTVVRTIALEGWSVRVVVRGLSPGEDAMSGVLATLSTDLRAATAVLPASAIARLRGMPLMVVVGGPEPVAPRRPLTFAMGDLPPGAGSGARTLHHLAHAWAERVLLPGQRAEIARRLPRPGSAGAFDCPIGAADTDDEAFAAASVRLFPPSTPAGQPAALDHRAAAWLRRAWGGR